MIILYTDSLAIPILENRTLITEIVFC